MSFKEAWLHHAFGRSISVTLFLAQDVTGRRQQFSTESYRHLEAEPSTVRTLAFFRCIPWLIAVFAFETKHSVQKS